jgi:hypothetical protein
MSDTSLFVLWFLGVPAALGLLALMLVSMEWAAVQLTGAAARCQSSIEDWRMNVTAESNQSSERRAFLNWLSVKTGTGPTAKAVDEQLVAAQAQAESIRALIEEEVPKAVLRCVETHRLMAKVTGACHMLEIAYEPECQQLRAQAVWLLRHTVEFLDRYPLRLDDTRLLHNSIVLRKRALPTCRRCPYIQQPVDQAGRLCPTAQLVQLRGVSGELGN